MRALAVYVPMDRRLALAQGAALPSRTDGAALFADISGFTPLTEMLVRELGPRRGAEELTGYLDRVYDAVIEEVHRYHGSVIAFAGDAITCWFDGADGPQQATNAALAMQEAMRPFTAMQTVGGHQVTLALKAAVATGPARRFLVGDPSRRVLDALAGATLARLASAEHHACVGEVIVDAPTLAAVGDLVETGERRHDADRDEWYTVVTRLNRAVAPAPWPKLPARAIDPAIARIWLLPAVYERLRQGLGDFLAELRPTVAVFVRFAGIDYDEDDEAEEKLHAYLAWVQEIVAQYDGTLVDLNIGDKGSYLYVNFGAPQAYEDNTERAAATALALRSLPPELDFILPVQIGISQGTMRAGAYGGTNHRTYGVLGDEVNMAARLMMAARPGQILMSEAAFSALRGQFTAEALPPIRVKGKREPVAIFALEGRRRRAENQLALTYDLPMIGRGAEREQLAQVLATVSAGTGQILGVGGEAGLGKSRLMAELAGLAEESGFALYIGECQSYGINSSYLVWHAIWRGLLNLDLNWPPEQQIAHLQDRLRAVNADLLPRLPLLGPLLGLEILDNELTLSLDAKLRKLALESLLVDLLRAQAAQHKLVLVLEDCHWLDPLSHDLLEALAIAAAGLPVLIAYTNRPVELERLKAERISKLAHHVEIKLGPLPYAEAAAFIAAKAAQLAGAEVRLPDDLVNRIITRADGNPFFVEELVVYLHNQGINLGDAAATAEIALPDNLQKVVLSLVDQLSEHQKITLKVASVVGRRFRAPWLAGAYQQLGALPRVVKDLEAICKRELVAPQPDEAELAYMFRQAIVQGVTYESLPFAARAALHEQFGGFLEQTYADDTDQVLDLLAYHYDATESLDKRRYYLRRAGESAQAIYANDAAIDYYQRLLPLLAEAERPPVLMLHGQVLELVGRWDEANERYQEALSLARTYADHTVEVQAIIAVGEMDRKRGRFADAQVQFVEVQAAAEQHDDRAGLAKALICLGTLAAQQGDYAAATAYYERSLLLRRAMGDRTNEANVLNNLGIVAQFQGDYAASRRFHSEALAIRRSLNNKAAIAFSLNNLGSTALDERAYVEAAAYLEESLALQRAIGDKWAIANALNNLANAQRELGQAGVAAAYYAESLRLNWELGEQRGLAYLLEDVGQLLAREGQAERALRLVAAAAAARERIPSPLSPAEQEQLDLRLDPAHAVLGPAAARAAWAAGRELTLEQAVAEALRVETLGA